MCCVNYNQEQEVVNLKKMVVLVLALGFIFGVSSFALDRKTGNVDTGKKIFKEQCKVCHNGKDAKKLTPAHKTRAQWKRYLRANAAKLARKHGADITKKLNLSEADVNNLWAFCYVGAMDSEKPQTCD
ncbi:MAG: hypothetical protein DRJ08_01465 [Acidobacteria bacterium]|nr:MAG: hypothetical protein DRJ08_01465 [Acidobacteriota bacterium]